MNKYDVCDALIKRRTAMYLDDFYCYVTADVWTTAASTATVAAGDLEGGQIVFTGDTTPNDYAYIHTTQKIFKFVNNNPLEIEAYVQFTQKNTNQLAFQFGFTSIGTAGQIVDTTGIPITTMDGAMLYTKPGSIYWNTISSLSTTQTTNVSNVVAGQTAWQRLNVVVQPVSSTIAEVTYYVNGLQLYTAANTITPIKDELTYTGGGVMFGFMGVKQISSAVAEVVNCDYIAWSQLRALFTP